MTAHSFKIIFTDQKGYYFFNENILALKAVARNNVVKEIRCLIFHPVFIKGNGQMKLIVVVVRCFHGFFKLNLSLSVLAVFPEKKPSEIGLFRSKGRRITGFLK